MSSIRTARISTRRPNQTNTVDAIHASTWRYLRSRDVAGDYDTFFAGSALFRFDTELLDRWFVRPGQLLDLGCGTGRHVLHFSQRGFRTVGVDLSESMLQCADHKLRTAGFVPDLHRLNLLDVQEHLPAGRFEYAACMFSTFGMIAGADNRHRFLCGVRRLLRPGGLLALHVHNRRRNLFSWEGQRFLLDNAIRYLRRQSEWGDKYLRWYRGIENLFIHVFSRAELEGVVGRAGFRVCELVRLNALRNGALRRGPFADWRAHGFVLLVERPRTVVDGAD